MSNVTNLCICCSFKHLIADIFLCGYSKFHLSLSFYIEINLQWSSLIYPYGHMAWGCLTSRLEVLLKTALRIDFKTDCLLVNFRPSVLKMKLLIVVSYMIVPQISPTPFPPHTVGRVSFPTLVMLGLAIWLASVNGILDDVLKTQVWNRLSPWDLPNYTFDIAMCYGLNICVLSQFVKILTTKVDPLRSRVFGRYLNHEGRTLMNVINVLSKRFQKDP